ncbi:TetR family transcriptional regulator [Nonomuraea phyllanthi]|uniref:TetR family transcriptional regulator n=1 Tax=Nonomuraea phyllanthi TaxID=2219224 RepID=A0A5C4WKW7_9ACTN|nr:TetR/AcrR family transcriptional regulator [Nonomuraea phyllanthi]KAB8194854.1 TetR family transcriptional regulator [Nonomuraea phyllanthi]QFY09283.1 TetR family transcriptional regulator [Nonomuraea phyllanthi]
MSHDAAPLMGRRERKKQATRAALREAALRLAIRDGVENLTVERIADEADIALRTFFNYFSSKEEAVVATVSSAAEALIAEFRARPRTESVLRAFREAVLVILNESDDANRHYLAVVRLIHRTPSLVPQQLAVLAAQEKALAEAIRERVDAAEGSVYPAVCASAVLAALRIVVNQWLEPEREPSAALLGREVDLVIAELAAGLDRQRS